MLKCGHDHYYNTVYTHTDFQVFLFGISDINGEHVGCYFYDKMMVTYGIGMTSHIACLFFQGLHT